jgi:hypothetical protein
MNWLARARTLARAAQDPANLPYVILGGLAAISLLARLLLLLR